MRPGGPNRSEVISRCPEPAVHILGEIVMGFGNVELFLETGIWHLLKGRGKNPLLLPQAVTAEMSFGRKVHAFFSMYRLKYPSKGGDAEVKELTKELFAAQEQRNAVLRSAWSYSSNPGVLERMKATSKAKHGLNRRMYQMSPARLEDVRVKIASVGNRLLLFLSNNVERQGTRRANNRMQPSAPANSPRRG